MESWRGKQGLQKASRSGKKRLGQNPRASLKRRIQEETSSAEQYKDTGEERGGTLSNNTPSTTRKLKLQISNPNQKPTRLDNLLCSSNPGLSRTVVRDLLKRSGVKPGQLIKSGDVEIEVIGRGGDVVHTNRGEKEGGLDPLR